MNKEAAKIGDVVAWADVPDGALVRTERQRWLIRRHDGEGSYVGEDGPSWPWGPYKERVTIVALGLSGQESADDLRRLAEMFEVREALDAMLVCPYCNNEEATVGECEDGSISQPWCMECDTEMGSPGYVDEAERLHAAGWRPGMTAEDAGRLLGGRT